MSHALWKTLLDPATPTNYELHFVNKDTQKMYVKVKCHREVMLASSTVMRQTQKFGTHMFNRVIRVPERDMDAALQVVEYMYTRDVHQFSPTHLETIKRLMTLLGLSGCRQVANLIHEDTYRQLTPVNSLAQDLLTNSVQTGDIEIVLMVQRYSYVTIPMHRAVACASSARLCATLRSYSGRQIPVELGKRELLKPCAHLLRFMYTHDPQHLKTFGKSQVMRVADGLQLSLPLKNILTRAFGGHPVTPQCATFQHKVTASTTNRIPTCLYHPHFWNRVQGVDPNAKRFIRKSKFSFGPTHPPPVSLIRPTCRTVDSKISSEIDSKSRTRFDTVHSKISSEIDSKSRLSFNTQRLLISAVSKPPVNFGPTHTPPVSLIRPTRPTVDPKISSEIDSKYRPNFDTQRLLITAVSKPPPNSSEFRHSGPPRTKKRKSLTECRPSDEIASQRFRPTKRVTRSQTRALRQNSVETLTRFRGNSKRKRKPSKTPVKRVVTRSQSGKKNRKTTIKRATTRSKRVAPTRRSARIRKVRLQHNRKGCKR